VFIQEVIGTHEFDWTIDDAGRTIDVYGKFIGDAISEAE
jgi:hypothetical protein